jgi:predicted nucleic acid-binding protein
MGLKQPIVILDTNIVSYIFKGGALADEYEQALLGYDARISFASAAELHYWAEKNRWGARRRLQLRVLLVDYPELPYHKHMAELCAKLRAEREHAGRRLQWADAWVATTALWYNAALVTHDLGFLHVPRLRVITATVGLGAEESASRYADLAHSGRVSCSF